MVSVIIPTYNRSQLVVNAVESALLQTYTDKEILVVIDGSTDNTKQVLFKYFGDSIRILYKENGGLSSARNFGIKHSQGDYIAFLDDDDEWCPQKLELQVKIIQENKETGLVYCAAVKNEVHKGRNIEKIFHCTFRGRIFEKLLEKNCIVGSGSSVLIKKDCFKDVGFFDENLEASEDYDMWLRIARKYPIDYVDKILVRLNEVSNSMSKAVERMEKGGFMVLDKIFSENEPSINMKRKKNYYYSLRFLHLMKCYYWQGKMKETRRCFYSGIKLHPLNLTFKNLSTFFKSFMPTIFKNIFIRLQYIILNNHAEDSYSNRSI